MATQNESAHPGTVLLEKHMRPRNLTQHETANLMGTYQSHISRIVRGKASIGRKTAKKLSILFGESPEFWEDMQRNYEKQKQAECIK